MVDCNLDFSWSQFCISVPTPLLSCHALLYVGTEAVCNLQSPKEKCVFVLETFLEELGNCRIQLFAAGSMRG